MSVADYRSRVRGPQAGRIAFNEEQAVTLEISACQYFPWVLEAARWALDRGALVPGRFITERLLMALRGQVP